MIQTRSNLYIGLMSGTSLDGIDAVLMDFSTTPPSLLASAFTPYPADLVEQLLLLHHSAAGELDQALQAGNALSVRYADLIRQLLQQAGIPAGQVQAIGNHGQTIRHQPQRGYSLQLGNQSLLAELTSIDVIGDFRSRDIAAGGQGAPLVPAFHRAVFGSPDEQRLILNIGGIANLSCLHPNGEVTGFDTGPGNVLMDTWTRLHLNTPYDRDGQWAASGNIIDPLLATLMSEPFLGAEPPKSTGRDLFNQPWLQSKLTSDWSPADVQATLLAFTCHSITQAITRFAPEAQAVYVCGGGAHNHALLDGLAQQLPGIPLATTTSLGIDPDWVEACAFAWLARQFVTRQAGNLCAVTGASGPRVLGALYPR